MFTRSSYRQRLSQYLGDAGNGTDGSMTVAYDDTGAPITVDNVPTGVSPDIPSDVLITGPVQGSLTTGPSAADEIAAAQLETTGVTPDVTITPSVQSAAQIQQNIATAYGTQPSAPIASPMLPSLVTTQQAAAPSLTFAPSSAPTPARVVYQPELPAANDVAHVITSGAQANPSIADIARSVGSVIQGGASAYQAAQLQALQLQRVQQGLPPLTAAQLAQLANGLPAYQSSSISPTTMMLLGGGALLLLMMSAKKKKR